MIGSDTIRILLTTDNHVGYNESDPIRGQDSARTFREAMEIARNREVSTTQYEHYLIKSFLLTIVSRLT